MYTSRSYPVYVYNHDRTSTWQIVPSCKVALSSLHLASHDFCPVIRQVNISIRRFKCSRAPVRVCHSRFALLRRSNSMSSPCRARTRKFTRPITGSVMRLRALRSSPLHLVWRRTLDRSYSKLLRIRYRLCSRRSRTSWRWVASICVPKVRS